MSRIKRTVSVSLSPYVLDRLEAYTGEGKRFATVSDSVNTSLIELFYRFEIRELAEAVKIEKSFLKEKNEKKNRRVKNES